MSSSGFADVQYSALSGLDGCLNPENHFSQIEVTVVTGNGSASDVSVQLEVNTTIFTVFNGGGDFNYISSVGNIDYYRTAPQTYTADGTYRYILPIFIQGNVTQPEFIPISLINANGCSSITQGTIEYQPETAIGQFGPPVLLSTLIGNNTLLTASQATNQKQTLKLTGTLVVDVDYTFGRNATPLNRDGTEIYMTGGARIIVDHGVSLGLSGTEVYGCDELWDRIELSGSASLSALNCIIEDGQYAVHLNADYGDAPAGVLTFINCDFIDNIYGIYTPPHFIMNKDIQFTFAPVSINTGFYSNHFAVDDDMLAPFEGMTEPNNAIRAGIHAYNWPELTTYGFSTEDSFFPELNLFEGLPSGILAHDCTMFLNSCKFTDFSDFGVHMTQENHADLYMNNSGNLSSVFDNANNKGTSIHSEAAITRIAHILSDGPRNGIEVVAQIGSQIEILDNDIRNFGNTGIRLIGDQGGIKEVADNQIMTPLAVTHGIRVLGNAITNPNETGWEIHGNHIRLNSIKHGVFMNASSSTDFTCNDVLNDVGTAGNFATSGLTANGCRALLARCNLIENPYNGYTKRNSVNWNMTSNSQLTCTNQYPGVNPGIISSIGLHVQNSADFSFFRGNVLDGAVTNLHYGPLSSTMGNVTVGQQVHNGNFFLGDGAVYNGLQGQVIINRYRVSTALDPQYLPFPDPNINTPGWFVNQAGITFECESEEGSVCDETQYPFQTTEGPGEFERAIMEGCVSSGPYEKIGNWMAARHLYYRLLNQPINPAGYDDFVSKHKKTSVGELEDAYRSLADVATMSVSDQKELIKLLSAEGVILHTIASLIHPTIDSPDLDAIHVQYIELTQVLTGIKSLLADLRASASNGFEAIRDDMATRTYKEVYEQDEQYLLDVATRVNLEGISILSAMDWVKINEIAYRCPDFFGEGVFRARSYLYRLDAELNDDAFDNTCLTNSSRLAADAPSLELLVYPNPASHEIFVNHPNNLSWSVIQIFNIEGIQVMDIRTPKAQVNTQSLLPGSYILRATDEVGVEYHAKINIQE